MTNVKSNNLYNMPVGFVCILCKKKLSKNMNVIGITLKMIINVTRGHSSGCDELAK